MSVKLVRPSARKRTAQVKIAATTAYDANSLLAPSDNATSDPVVAATATSNSIAGVLDRAITNTEYAVDTFINVIRDEDGEYEFTVGTGTADVNDEGGLIDLADNLEVDVTASSKGIARVTKYISGTKIKGTIDKWS